MRETLVVKELRSMFLPNKNICIDALLCRADQLANPYIMETLVINRLKITRLKLHFHPGRGSGKPLSANKVANSSTYTS